MFEKIPSSEIEKIMYADLFFLQKRSKSELEDIKKSWLNQLLYCELNIPLYKGQDYLFLRSLERNDYKSLFHSIASQCLSEKIFIEDFVYTKPTINIDASKFLSENYGLSKYFNYCDEDYLDCLTIRFIYYCYIVSNFLHFSPKVFVSFSDMQPVDYLATLCFKDKGIKTVTLQHGLYVDYSGVDTVNVVNYINQPSDYFLAWGKNTKDLIESYHESSCVVVCGKPNINKIEYQNSKTVLVVFDQEIFNEQNIEMYKIVSDFAHRNELKILVRFHPHNNVPAYEKKLGPLNTTNELGGHSLVVGHTSSLLFELQAMGQFVLQYKSSIPTINMPVSSQFNSIDSIGERFLLFNEFKPSFGGDIIECISEDSSLRYREFFDELVESPKNTPFFSIIIPTFNSAMTLWKSIDSLKSQSFEDFEVIIQDGQSSDMTVSFALSYIGQDARFKVYSSEDSGTYDAMNKGINKAKGDWVYFMGSDDRFKDRNVLYDIHNKISQCDPTNLGMVYGNVEVVGDVKWAKHGTIYDGEFDDDKIKQKNICHQAIFYNRKSKLKHLPYNLKYRLCADWDMNLKVWSSSRSIYVNRVVAEFLAGGQSTDGSDPEFGKDFKNNIKQYFS
ncbi:glycosyltransferase family 2 protein [Vibrio rotiferianus]|uniref:glycosyltransferase family 2 protein n=1 Tax=Vibrio rotiferianus TaxID=190895 RepID=UPI003908C687